MILQEKGVEIIGYVGKEIPDYVIGDPNRLRQVMNNLVSNAVKFTSSGEIVIGLKRAEQNREDLLNSLIGLENDCRRRCCEMLRARG